MSSELRITSKYDLKKILQDNIIHSDVILENDIDFKGEKIRGASEIIGDFYGNGNKIKNINIVCDGEKDSGLFLNNYGTIENLIIVNSKVTSNFRSGLITSKNNGTIRDCKIINSTAHGQEQVGGITGMNKGTVDNCSVRNTSIIKAKISGGLVGHNFDGKIVDCSFDGELESDFNDCGGISGINNGIINSSVVSGTVRGEERVGGITGNNIGDIIYCKSKGEVEGKKTVGGVVGINKSRGALYKSSNNSTVQSSEKTNERGIIRNFLSNSNKERKIGEVVGFNKRQGTIENCYWVKGNNNLKGIGVSYSNVCDEEVEEVKRNSKVDSHIIVDEI